MSATRPGGEGMHSACIQIRLPTSLLKAIDRLRSLHEPAISRDEEIVTLLNEALAARKPKKPEMPKGRAAGEPEPKVERLKRFIAAEDWRAAFKLAASLPRLGDDRVAIQRAQEAITRPDFVRELGRDPDALIKTGKDVLRRRWGNG